MRPIPFTTLHHKTRTLSIGFNTMPALVKAIMEETMNMGTQRALMPVIQSLIDRHFVLFDCREQVDRVLVRFKHNQIADVFSAENLPVWEKLSLPDSGFWAAPDEDGVMTHRAPEFWIVQLAWGGSELQAIPNKLDKPTVGYLTKQVDAAIEGCTSGAWVGHRHELREQTLRIPALLWDEFRVYFLQIIDMHNTLGWRVRSCEQVDIEIQNFDEFKPEFGTYTTGFADFVTVKIKTRT